MHWLLQAQERITSAGHEGVGRELDVTSQDSVDAIIKACADLKGAPTILVNNAGITRDNLLMRMKENEWQDIMDTNLSSVFRMSKAVLRGMMKAKKGRIISITSIVGSIGNAGQANYSAAKAGVDGFSRALAREIASRNITVNTVAPGFIDTDMTRALSDEQREILQKEIPLGRLGTPDDIAAAVMFLASEGGSYITGNTIHVNGGMYMG
jgi:3-oxoacyl-[acyl-carrier protein] reductase